MAILLELWHRIFSRNRTEEQPSPAPCPECLARQAHQTLLDEALRRLPLDPTSLASKSCELAGDYAGLLHLKDLYASPGPAYQHMVGLILAWRDEARAKVEAGAYDSMGRDLSDFYRFQLRLCERILALPAFIDRELEFREAQMKMGQTSQPTEPVPMVAGWPDLVGRA